MAGNKKLSKNKKLEQIKSPKSKQLKTKLKPKNIKKGNLEQKTLKAGVGKENSPMKNKNTPKLISEEKGLEISNSKNVKVPLESKNIPNAELENEDEKRNNSDHEDDDEMNGENKKDSQINNITKNGKNNLEKDERTVFVGNIPSNSKINHMKRLFEKCTIVSCRFRLANGKPILKHKMRKDADSINAWVVFENKKDVEHAIKLNGSIFKGKHIRVTISVRQSPNNQNDKCKIFVGNLKYSANDEKLYSIFSSCGEIEFVRTIKNEKGCCGVGYVCFKKPESVGLALELNNTLLDDRPIHVEKYSKNKSGTSMKNKPDTKLSGVERRVMSKLMKNKNISEKLPYNNFNNKREGKKFTNKKFDTKTKSENNKKKSEFRGIKVDSKKKFKKKNNKKSFNTLAKKIAPKD